MNSRDVACVILASGLSERFGDTDKLEASLCGIPVLKHVLKTVSSVGFGEVFLVSKFDGPREVTTVLNHDSKLGHGHSLRLGLGAARRAGWENICVMLGDMPLVDGKHLKKMINVVNAEQSVISRFNAANMPPAIFNSSAVSKILSANFEAGARKMFEQLDLITLPITEIQTLDVDTRQDLNRLEAIMKTQAT